SRWTVSMFVLSRALASDNICGQDAQGLPVEQAAKLISRLRQTGRESAGTPRFYRSSGRVRWRDIACRLTGFLPNRRRHDHAPTPSRVPDLIDTMPPSLNFGALGS